MGADPFTAIAIGGALGLGGASIVTSELGRKEQRKAARMRQRVSEAQNTRERMAQVRQQRIAQAQIQQAAATQGTLGGSAAQGGYSAVGSLTAGNIGFINAMENMNQDIARNLENSSRYQGYAQTATALGNLALTASNMGFTSPATPAQVGAVGGKVGATSAGSASKLSSGFTKG